MSGGQRAQPAQSAGQWGMPSASLPIPHATTIIIIIMAKMTVFLGGWLPLRGKVQIARTTFLINSEFGERHIWMRPVAWLD